MHFKFKAPFFIFGKLDSLEDTRAQVFGLKISLLVFLVISSFLCKNDVLQVC